MRYLVIVDAPETQGVTRVLAEAGFPPLGNLFLRPGKRHPDDVVWTVEVTDPAPPKLDAIRAALTEAGFDRVTIEPDRRAEDRRRQ